MNAPTTDRPPRPSSLPRDLRPFDRFAGQAATLSGRAPFFAACVAIIVIWVPTMFLIPLDTSQLVIQTVTAIVTFLLVALLQNSQTRSDAATQHKLNEIADALANLIDALDLRDDRLVEDMGELRAAVGLEKRERS